MSTSGLPIPDSDTGRDEIVIGSGTALVGPAVIVLIDAGAADPVVTRLAGLVLGGTDVHAVVDSLDEHAASGAELPDLAVVGHDPDGPVVLARGRGHLRCGTGSDSRRIDGRNRRRWRETQVAAATALVLGLDPVDGAGDDVPSDATMPLGIGILPAGEIRLRAASFSILASQPIQPPPGLETTAPVTPPLPVADPVGDPVAAPATPPPAIPPPTIVPDRTGLDEQHLFDDTSVDLDEGHLFEGTVIRKHETGTEPRPPDPTGPATLLFADPDDGPVPEPTAAAPDGTITADPALGFGHEPDPTPASPSVPEPAAPAAFTPAPPPATVPASEPPAPASSAAGPATTATPGIIDAVPGFAEPAATPEPDLAPVPPPQPAPPTTAPSPPATSTPAPPAPVEAPASLPPSASSRTSAPSPVPAPVGSAPADGRDDGGLEAMTVAREVLRARRLAEPTDSAGDGLQVTAVVCDQDHANPPHYERCRVCDSEIWDRSMFIIRRPPLGVLRFGDGREEVLDENLVIGRRPAEGLLINEQPTRAVVLPSPDGGLSRTHAIVQIEGWQVQVVDRDSTNNTFVTVPGQAEFQLRPGEPFPIPPGTTVRLGDDVEFSFTVTP